MRKNGFLSLLIYEIEKITLLQQLEQGRSLLIFKDLLMEEGLGHPYHLSLEAGNPSTVFMKVKDQWCWDLHAKEYPGAERGFVACEVDLEIDVNGDGEVIWPANKLNTKRRLPFP